LIRFLSEKQIVDNTIVIIVVYATRQKLLFERKVYNRQVH
jgi:hypothetical protein